jgi:hypothetical protein
MTWLKTGALCASFAAAGLWAGGGESPATKAGAEPPMIQVETRAMTRALWFAQKDGKFSVPGQFCFQYGAPKWSDKYGEQLKSSSLKRWRFGKDTWTTYDATIPAKIGGVAVPAGLYYVVLERDAKGGYALVLLDPKDAREKKLDAFQADATTGGIVVPLKHETVEDGDGDFKIVITSGKDLGFETTYGPHKLTAPIVAAP